ncbi:metallophosphoesterase [Niveispirillum sp. BGYR6]|uniref:metallophosphoesterase family protein n=1 Tax=Niveispirillum sp. BGYR6 TaxID=2971249 RepID=UPI0022B96334|nr:metallophosphoesterase [Niveispirillum sp. BGYR6]MDG5496702.1 metallophosphoesterase [Niveispirillum sp. BGYR6]
MRLWAIADLHLAAAENRAALASLPDHGDDWLILAGDVAERPDHLDDAFSLLARRFARLIWVPGNHELWTLPGPDGPLRGQAKYQAMLDVARRHGVLTPEDPYPVWPGPGGPVLIVPLFLLYDYSFRPATVAAADVLAWAWEHRLRSADEVRLSPAPHDSRAAWCAARVAATAERLTAERPPEMPTILVNHFPLRADLVTLRRIPRFSPWCGTVRTQDWHQRFGAVVCVHGHLHVPATHWRDGVRFEEVSLGYPKQWQPHGRGPAQALRLIWPPPVTEKAAALL